MKSEELRKLVKQEANRVFDERSRVEADPVLDACSVEQFSFSTVADFQVPLSDEEFLKLAYRKILGRDPDQEGFEHYLKRLKSGKYYREDVLFAMRYGKEGRRRKVPIKGLISAVVLSRLSRIPVLEFFFMPWRLARIASPEVLRNSLRYQFAHVKDSQRSLRHGLEKELKRIDLEIERLAVELKGEKRRMEEKELEVRRDLGNIRENLERLEEKRQAASSLTEQLIKNLDFSRLIEKQLSHPLSVADQLYTQFEDRFRGARQNVKEGFKVYLSCIEELNISEDFPAVDLGCGRGEWLGLLKKHGIPAVGVDINPVFVKFCRGMGLNAVEEDIFEFLKKQPDDSVSLFSAFHFIEHLPFELILKFLRETYRCLKPSGMLILETPNPRNLLVAAGDFFRDPSHVRPVFPDTLEVLTEAIGFRMGRAFFFSEDRSQLIEARSVRFDSLEDYLKVSRDYAWIGYKL
ncbi:MAG: methyltransferase domain-containing protein [Deltaproteobacteria bacterium]|nr:methyltransferase domain-containing protein [Deltaproteobacteria bacterium]MBW2069273.1 methyltransferase domain-containing protein [Deltaproteobacteria bacterium]